MVKVRLYSDKRFNRIVMNHPGVQKAIDRETRLIEGQSRARLAKHRKSGDHGIRVFKDRHTRVIELFSATKDGAPMSVQFGHWSPSGVWVYGLFILPTEGD